ncbi:MAG: hypothetical protein ACI85N_000473 [Gammaproteobacteria bacterium]|jgi:hypothetical protein
MHFFRKLIDHKKLSGLLLFGLLLRSLIASGFMLDTNPADGSLLSIVICEGPASINAIAGLSEQAQQHEHHQHHQQHDSDEHDHEAQDHSLSACSFWSSSSQSLAANVLFFDVVDAKLTDEVAVYQTQFIHRYSNNSRLARAPPSLS